MSTYCSRYFEIPDFFHYQTANEFPDFTDQSQTYGKFRYVSMYMLTIYKAWLK